MIEAGTINTFKSRLQRLHDKDESVFWRYSFSRLQRPSQLPGEASSGKISGKIFKNEK